MTWFSSSTVDDNIEARMARVIESTCPHHLATLLQHDTSQLVSLLRESSEKPDAQRARAVRHFLSERTGAAQHGEGHCSAPMLDRLVSRILERWDRICRAANEQGVGVAGPAASDWFG